MGTLGCINDMLQRDKENRALRQRNRERLKGTRQRLIDASNRNQLPEGLTLEQVEHIARQSHERERWEKRSYLRGTLLFIATAVMMTVAVAMLIKWLSK